MTRQARRRALQSLALAVAALAAVGVALPGLTLGPGLPLPEVQAGRLGVPAASGAGVETVPVSLFLLTLLGCCLAALVLHAAWRALRGVAWRDVARTAVKGLLVLGLACAALAFVIRLLPPGEPGPVELPLPPPLQVVRAPLGDPPALLRWLVAAALAACAAAALGLLARRAPPPGGLLGRIALEAAEASAAIRAGRYAGDVVVACWARMSAAVAEAHGVERSRATTAREFAAALEALGLPRAPVEELTGLLEAVRYGERRADERQEARALACLEAIVAACRPREEP